MGGILCRSFGRSAGIWAIGRDSQIRYCVIQAACWRGLDLERLVFIELRARLRRHDEISIKTNMAPIRGWGIKASG
jgi:hypothetical protein